MSKKFSLFIGLVCMLAAVPTRADEGPVAGDMGRGSDEPVADTDGEGEASLDDDWGPPPGEDFATSDEAELEARVRVLGRYLEDVQKGRRRYFSSWMVISAGLIGGQAILLRDEHQPGIRAGYLSSIGLATASVGLQFLRLGPGLTAYSRFARMPDRWVDEKKAKIAAGEEWLAAQATADRKATSWLAHVMGAGAATLNGVLLSLLYENNLKEGLRRLIGTFVIAELTILTRPTRAITYYETYTGTRSAVELAVAPWGSVDSYGLGLNGRF